MAHRELVIRVVDHSGGHVVEMKVNGECTEKAALMLLVTAADVFTKASGLSFDEMVQELSAVVGERSEPIFPSSGIRVTN